MTNMQENPSRSCCPIACTLDVIGDRWSLVIIRDMFAGTCRFNAFLHRPEAITTNILADRLRRLEQAGLVTKRRYQHRPARYEYRLTPKGEALQPVLEAICQWADNFMAEAMIAREGTAAEQTDRTG